MDKTALALIEKALRVPTKQVPTTTHLAAYIVDDLGANGYVVVPRHLLDALTDAARHVQSDNGCRSCSAVSAARAAVVEAVGPTREDH